MTEMTGEDRTPRAAEYVLRLLTPQEQTAFEAEMQTDPELQSDVADWVDHFAGLNDGFAPAKPRAALKAQLMARLFGAPPPVPLWRRVWLWQGVSLAAIALAAFLAVEMLRPAAPEGPGYVAEIAAEDNSLRLLAVYDPASGQLHVTRTVGTAPAGRVLELWAIQGDAAPASLGVLPDEGTARLTLPAAYHGAEGLVLAISDEPPGGSPTGAPTGSVLATGAPHGL